MRQRILIAEKSDAIRGVAETVLRQNGFEVISVSNADKALEVLKFTRPDLIIVGADLKTKNNRPFYDRITEDPKAASVPLLLFADPSDESLPHSSDVRIPRPFDTKQFVQKVTSFVRPTPNVVETATVTENPLQGAHIGDDLLNEALGLDRLEVVDSEVMDRTTTTHKISVPRSSTSDSGRMASYDEGGRKSEHGDSGPIVESLHIREGDTSVNREAAHHDQKSTVSAEDGLEIVTDHHAYQNPEAFSGHQQANHDYEWFVNEMKNDGQIDRNKPTQNQAVSHNSKSNMPPQSEELVFENPSTMVDPLTPPPAQTNQKSKDPGKSGNVEKFIDEFRKEVEKFRANDGQAPAKTATSVHRDTSSRTGTQQGAVNWEESVEHLSPEDVAIFTRQVADKIGENVARMIVDKLDAEKLLRLLKQEILDQVRKQSTNR